MQNTKKKRIILIAVTVCLMIFAAVSGISLATLTAQTEKRANVFTFGNVTIELKEPEWDKLDPEDKVVYPGKSVNKDPTVKNTGSNDLYAYIEVKIPKKNVRTVVTAADGKDTIKDAEERELFSYEVNTANWTKISETKEPGADYNVYLYAYTNSVLKSNEKTSPLFSKVKYLDILEGEIEMGTVIEMPITAYAIQSDHLGESGADMEQKMKDAFEKYKSEINA